MPHPLDSIWWKIYVAGPQDYFDSSYSLAVCTDPPINYHVSSFTFSPSAEAHISCNINSPQWWVSEDPCGPFTRSALCPQRSNLCSFNVTHIANRFYHCCTSGGAVEDSLAEVGDSGNCVRIESESKCTAYSPSGLLVKWY